MRKSVLKCIGIGSLEMLWSWMITAFKHSVQVVKCFLATLFCCCRSERILATPTFSGTVVSFCRQKGHGFVQPSDGTEPLFMHISEWVLCNHDNVIFYWWCPFYKCLAWLLSGIHVLWPDYYCHWPWPALKFHTVISAQLLFSARTWMQGTCQSLYAYFINNYWMAQKGTKCMGHSCHGLPSCQFSACYALLFLT